MQRNQQTVLVIKLSKNHFAHLSYAGRAKLVLHHVGPNVVEFAEGDVQRSPLFKSRRCSHDHSHELIPAVVALAEVQALIGFGQFLALMPKRKSAAENGSRVGLFRFITHHFPITLRPDSFLE